MNPSTHKKRWSLLHPRTISDLVPYTLKAANDTVLSLGSDMPLPGSVPSLLTVSEKNTKTCNRNGFSHQTADKASPPCCSTENGDDHSSSSNSEGAGTKNSTPIKNSAVQDFAPAPRLNGSPWTYSWIPSPPLCASSFPVPFYPVAAAYWSCLVPPGSLSGPRMSPPPTSFPLKSCPQGAAPVPISPTLAKRSRDKDAFADGTVLKKSASRKHDSHERCIWTTKALRVDDLEETAKSSIRTMIGCKNGKVDAVSDGCLFKLFHPSDKMMNRAVRPSQLLHLNPAAVSLSLSFQESS